MHAYKKPLTYTDQIGRKIPITMTRYDIAIIFSYIIFIFYSFKSIIRKMNMNDILEQHALHHEICDKTNQVKPIVLLE